MAAMKLEVYKDKRGEWRWRVKTRNGKLVAEGGEGYKNKKSMVRNLVKFFAGATLAAQGGYYSEYNEWILADGTVGQPPEGEA